MRVCDEGIEPGERIPRRAHRGSGLLEHRHASVGFGERHRDRCAHDAATDDANPECAWSGLNRGREGWRSQCPRGA